jgi:hypothetical protein
MRPRPKAPVVAVALGTLIATVVVTILLGVATASAARETIPYRWKNCTIVNKRFLHGVGKLSAHDRTKSGDPVTNFRRSTRLYLEGRRLWHDPRKRQCALASLTSFAYRGDELVSVSYEQPAHDLVPVRASKKFVAGA